MHTTNTYVRRVEKIIKKLPKPIECLTFLHHDLPLQMDICEEVREDCLLPPKSLFGQTGRFGGQRQHRHLNSVVTEITHITPLSEL